MAVNTVKPVPRDFLLNKLRDKLDLTDQETVILRELFQRTDVTLNVDGSIKPQANVSGRTEQLSATLQNVDATGKILAPGVDFSRAYTNKNIDNIADGATFGRVVVTALTANQPDLSQPGVINKNAGNIAETSSLKWRTAAHSATQPTNIVITGTDTGGGHASISFPSFTMRVPGLADYTANAGLALGLNNSTAYFLYLDDSTFSGTGSLQATTDQNALFANSGRFYLGSVTTPAGGAGNTTGKPGGTGGGVNRATVLS